MNISTRMPQLLSLRVGHVLLRGAAVTGLLICGRAVTRAQQPSPPVTTAPAVTVTEGIVHSFTNAPRGEVDGATLETGVRLHWPPRMQNRFKDILVTGDQVRAIGRVEIGKGGDPRFEVQRLINLRSTASAENPDFGAPAVPRVRPTPMVPPNPPAQVPAVPTGPNLDVRTITGAVRSLSIAPRGEIDGAVLNDGVLIHWPPHMQDQFRGLVAVGDRLRVTGRMETGPAGDTHFEVQSVTNLRTNQMLSNSEFAIAPVAPAAPGVVTPAAPREIPASLETRLQNIEKRLDQLQRILTACGSRDLDRREVRERRWGAR